MHSKYAALFWVSMLVLLLSDRAALGQPADVRRTIGRAVAAPVTPTITILTAVTGALVRSQGAGNASLDLGPVSYFEATSAPGETSQKNSKSFVVSTRFALKVECPGSSPSSQVRVTVSSLDGAASHAITIDGTTLGSASQPLVQSMQCGSSGEHRLDVEVPVSTPAGSIGSTIAFVATLKK
jgi:hypothetical protein